MGWDGDGCCSVGLRIIIKFGEEEEKILVLFKSNELVCDHGN